MPKKPFIGPLPKCIVTGCVERARYISVCLCGKHDMRLRRYGDVNHVTTNETFRKICRDAAVKASTAKPSTYRKLHNRHEHRVVAEQMLGRPLLRGEIVHHVDGDKHNNSPDNLQVMTQADHLRLHHAEMWKARKIKYGYST